MSAETQLRCPACGRWLGEVGDYARLVCLECGAETTYRSRVQRSRDLTPQPARPRLLDSKGQRGEASLTKRASGRTPQ